MIPKIAAKKIFIGKRTLNAILIPLQAKNLIVLQGRKGYIMCGYLNLKVANTFRDVAIKIIGVATIREALKANVHSCTNSAKKMGIHKGQPIKDVLRIIA